MVALGSYWPHSIRGEIFENGHWIGIADPPTLRSLSHYAVIYNTGNFYYFGGYSGYSRDTLSSILCLHAATLSWSNVGQLNSARYGHGVIKVENIFMVIGGFGNQPNEACLLINGQFICEEKPSSLKSYAYKPLLFPVSGNFGKC